MTLPRVLFVDDEPRILDGLRRSLRGKRHDWEMSFVTSGAAALELLGEIPQDVVVSDMRMPGMSGAELFTQISKQYPGVARVVLSGHTEPAAAIMVALVGHRFLTKPADVEHVIAVISQLTVVRSGGRAPDARRLAGAVRTLPTPVTHVPAVTALLTGPDVDLAGVVRAASHNVGLVAKLLQLATSPFFTSRPRIGSFESMINAVGVPTLQALVNTGHLLWSAPVDGAVERHLEQALRHAVATADLVGATASPGNRAYARAAAMLQDVGLFACLAGTESPVDLTAATVDGVPHREVGVELLRLWGLPSPIVAAVAHRDNEHRPTSSGLGVSAAVRAAHLLLQRTDSRDPTDGPHDDELAVLLSHPQVAATPARWTAAHWTAAAQEASERAGCWPPDSTPEGRDNGTDSGR